MVQRRSYTVRSVTNNTARYNGLGPYARKAAKQTGAKVSRSMTRVVKGISKDETLRTMETKMFQYQAAIQGIASGSNANVTAFNVFYPFSNGDLANNVDGASIYTLDLVMNYQLSRVITATPTPDPVAMRVTLIKTPVFWSNTGSTPFIPQGNIPVNAFTGTVASGTSPTVRTWNPNTVTVLGVKYVNLRGANTTGASNEYVTGVIRFPKLRGKKTFLASYSGNVNLALGQTKTGNYYVVIELFSGSNSTASNNILLNYDLAVKYKDI
uniref:Putative capsid protein n=1 Tax=Marmot associated feces circular DNA molecule 2 TaxID=2800893 RepID=A0A7T7DFS4_9VIRU|nr:putative capsid protein [Marmot associated feces circular DNA molecule 2]